MTMNSLELLIAITQQVNLDSDATFELAIAALNRITATNATAGQQRPEIESSAACRTSVDN